MEFIIILRDVLRGQRKIGYVGVKVFLRNYLNNKYRFVETFGERDYINYKEPSNRWFTEINKRVSRMKQVVYLLGIERIPQADGSYRVGIVVINKDPTNDWLDFIKKYRPILAISTDYLKP